MKRQSNRRLRDSTKLQAMTRSNYYRKLAKGKEALYNKSKAYYEGSGGLYAFGILEGSM